MVRRLDGKVAIVTGAGGGIGAEYSKLLASQGARVIVNDISTTPGTTAQEVVDVIVAEGGAAAIDTNSATWGSASAIVEHAVDEYGRLDILINNATKIDLDDLWNLSEEGWDRTLAVNLKGYLAMMQAAVPHLAKQATSSIVNTSSGSGFGHPGMIAYAAAKEGVVGLTRTAAMEVGRFGIRCNAIRPVAASAGTVDYIARSQRWAKLQTMTMGPVPDEDSYKYVEMGYPAKNVAPFVVWLCTEAAEKINGRTFDVGGDHIWLLAEPGPNKWESALLREGGLDLDAIDEFSPTLLQGLENRFTLDGHPDMQVFPSVE